MGAYADEVADSNTNVETTTDDTWNDVVLSETQVTRAVGTSITLELNNVEADANTYKISFTSDNNQVASVDEAGNVQAVAIGTANINCIVTLSDNTTKTYTCAVTVTDPKFSESSYIIGKGGSIQLAITGTKSKASNLLISDTSIASVTSTSKLTVKAKKKGSVSVQAEVDGRTLVGSIEVTQPKISKTLCLLVKGKSYQLTMSGHSKKTPVVYSIKDSKVASISKTGVIKGLKYGSTVVTVNVDNANYTATVAVGKKSTIGMIKKAQTALGKRYSQPKRMKTNYYDCSSLVWRSYKTYKYYLGNKKYAPTAAAQAHYLVGKKKVVSYKYVSESKLQPGDVLYISTKKNGRYKNITHTAIYIGNNTIIHATPPKVTYATYTKYKKSIVVIARPTK
ncbi:bacterial surface protein [Lachnospiraceae bacterium KM106-2]|nr:bacterial surface protein [Lachnospiraceae bacterium KM106-2]